MFYLKWYKTKTSHFKRSRNLGPGRVAAGLARKEAKTKQKTDQPVLPVPDQMEYDSSGDKDKEHHKIKD